MTATFADLVKTTEGIYTSYDHFGVPQGHFAAIVCLHRNTNTFLLEGDKDDPQAVIKGKVIITKNWRGKSVCTAYQGSKVFGGTSMGNIKHHDEAFAKMV